MSKVKLLLVLGILLILEGYFYFFRAFLPVGSLAQFGGDDQGQGYIRAVELEAQYDFDIVCYSLGFILIALALVAKWRDYLANRNC